MLLLVNPFLLLEILKNMISGLFCIDQMIDSRFRDLVNHCKILLKKKWLFGIVDDFITKQLPHNVTWGLSLLYAMEHKGDRSLTSTLGKTTLMILQLYVSIICCLMITVLKFLQVSWLMHYAS